MDKFVGQGCAQLGEAAINPLCCLCLPPLPKEHVLCHAFQFSTRFTGFNLISIKAKNAGALKLERLRTDSLPLIATQFSARVTLCLKEALRAQSSPAGRQIYSQGQLADNTY